MLELEIGREVVVEEGRKVRFDFEVEYVLELEHSLASLSKWESKWKKPFLSEERNTTEETLSYIECMVVTPNPPKDFIFRLVQRNIDAVNEYINDSMTATWFNDTRQSDNRSSEKITYELIMYWLSNLPSLPPDYKTWHLNQLFTFIKIHDVKNSTSKKMSPAESAAHRRAENARRRVSAGSRG